jgi:hypothetical protein
VKLDEYLDLLAEAGLPFSVLIKKLKASLVLSALTASRNSRGRAAKLLDINRTTLVEMLKVMPEAAEVPSNYRCYEKHIAELSRQSSRICDGCGHAHHSSVCPKCNSSEWKPASASGAKT